MPPISPRTKRQRSYPSPALNHSSQSSYQPPAMPQTPIQTPSKPNALGMPTAAKTASNLKVLRRRDPSIIGILDQFVYVCIYHAEPDGLKEDGTINYKWVKQGFEGSMFLYERDSYPPYGLYCLNRSGVDDFIQPIYPEDTLKQLGNGYLQIKTYPEFTKRRLAQLQSQISLRPGATPPDKFDPIYKFDAASNPVEKRGEASAISLWMHINDKRESLLEVMPRLHAYIEANLPYPEEFRYGPHNPPPPGRSLPPSRTPSSNSLRYEYDASNEDDNQGEDEPDQTELAALLAKLGTSASLVASTPPPSNPNSISRASTTSRNSNSVSRGSNFGSVSRNSVARADSKLSLASLFASVPQPTPPPQSQSQAQSEEPRGLSLLNSIFASASSNLTEEPESINIYSPTPTSTALPQILSQGVIEGLMGLPSRSSSASVNSRPSSTSESVYLAGPGIIVAGDDVFDLNAVSFASDREIRNLHPHSNSSSDINGRGRDGDVTPRAPFASDLSLTSVASNASISPASTIKQSKVNRTFKKVGTGSSDPSPQLPAVTRAADQHSTIDPPNGTSQLPTNGVAHNGHNGSNGASTAAPTTTKRTLVPFEPESDLWPYPRAPVDDSEDGEGIVELDFEDTSVLSNPAAFEEIKHRRGRNGSHSERDHPEANGFHDADGSNGYGKKAGKGKKAPKGKLARDRERQEIEKSWDFPGTSSEEQSYPSLSAPASPSPVASPELTPAAVAQPVPTALKSVLRAAGAQVAEARGRDPRARYESLIAVNGSKLNGKTNGKVTGKDIDLPSAPPSTANPTANGSDAVNRDAARESILSGVLQQKRNKVAPVGIERNDFVREVLTLIHTDKSFVDSLWQDYLARASLGGAV